MSGQDDLMIGKQGADPLTAGPRSAQELFKRYSRETNGFPHDAAIGAAANIILNSVRQSYKNRKDADDAIRHLLEKMRSTLGDHYTSLGERRSIFPFHQVIEMPIIRFDKKKV